MPIPINLVFEDELSEYVLTRLLECFGDKFYTGISYNGRGFGYLRSNINGFNQAAISIPFLVLTDLDNNTCVPSLITEWFRQPVNINMIFRVAVREVEAWLLADTEGFSEFIGVSKANFPDHPENEEDPKRTLINLTRRSRNRHIKDDIVPMDENASIGPGYNSRLMQFVFHYWNVERAMERSISLRKAYHRLDEFNYTIPG